MLKLEKIGLKHQDEIFKVCKEYNEYKDDYNGAFFLRNINDYRTLLKELDDSSNWIVSNQNYVPCTCYVAINDKNRIVGVGSLRYFLNDDLKKHGGHIGYSVLPTERRKGYGTQILKLLLEESRKRNIDKVLVTCDENNIGSIKVINKNNGVLEDKIKEQGRVTLRFWIEN